MPRLRLESLRYQGPGPQKRSTASSYARRLLLELAECQDICSYGLRERAVDLPLCLLTPLKPFFGALLRIATLNLARCSVLMSPHAWHRISWRDDLYQASYSRLKSRSFSAHFGTAKNPAHALASICFIDEQTTHVASAGELSTRLRWHAPAIHG